jgi:hypothetical protein
MEYARKYWDLEFPIINDDNEIVSYDRVRFGKYGCIRGWNPKKEGDLLRGRTEFYSRCEQLCL